MESCVNVSVEDGVAILAVANPPVNTIDARVRRDLTAALAALRGERVDAYLLYCEGSTFFSGADIGEFEGEPKESEYRDLFRSIEQLEAPVVAVMHGTVMGGGLEIALACHYRLCVEGARLGLPELSLGIIPGAGGTQRMPRLIGCDKTLEMLLKMAPVPADEAVELGFVDTVLQGEPRSAGLAWLRQALEGGLPPRRTCDRPVDPASASEERLAGAVELCEKRFRGRTAPGFAFRAVEAAAELPFEEGLLLEDRLVNEAKATPESRALVHLFFADRATRRIPDLAEGTGTRKITRAAIVGAGTMGSGIAMCFANAGFPAVLIDVSEESLQRGLDHIEATYASRVKRGRMTEESKAATQALIDGATGLDAAADADIVVEAVFESMELKRSIFAQLSKITGPECILATNTSTLDINEIAVGCDRPADVIGMHFFSPANVMPLLEVVRTDHTAPAVIRTVMDLARPLRKTPVLARVCYGFIGNRMMEPYGREAELMALEGATPRQIDSAMEEFGFAMGLLAVYDMAGVDVGVIIHRENADKFPVDPTYYQASAALFDAGRLGQKNGHGFYRYEPGNRTRFDDPEALGLLEARALELGVSRRDDHTPEEIVERCIYSLINEGFRILEEGVAIRAADIDVVWTSGYGFPRHLGGPMHYAERIGLATVLHGIERYRDRFGPTHWQASTLLEDLVARGETLAGWSARRAA